MYVGSKIGNNHLEKTDARMPWYHLIEKKIVT